MTLRYSTSDSYASNHDNHSCLPRIHRGTTAHLIDSGKNPKDISAAYSSSLLWTVAPTLTALLKTTYNKVHPVGHWFLSNRVSGQLLSRFTVVQAQTAAQITRMTTLASIDVTPQMQKSHSPFLFLNYCEWHICIFSILRIKTRDKKLNHNFFLLFNKNKFIL